MVDETKSVEGGRKPPKAPEAEAAPRAVPFYVFSEDRWKLKEHMNPGGWACVTHGCLPEDLLEPSAWANVARHLRAGMTVEVHWDDSSHFAEFYVLSAGRNWASVSLLRAHKLDRPKLPQQANQYDISYNGPVDKFRITRRNDGAVIRSGFASESEARKHLDEYVRKLAA